MVQSGGWLEREMTMRRAAQTVMLCLCVLVLAACGGMREGYFSMPYIEGDDPGENEPVLPYKQDELALVYMPGMTFDVVLRNDLQTSDTIWFLIIPTNVNLEDDWRYPVDREGFCVILGMRPEVDGMSVDVRQIDLVVDGVPFMPYRAYKRIYQPDGPLDTEAVRGRRPLNKGMLRYYRLCYDTERPLPEREIRLELGEAVKIPGGRYVPPIRFIQQPYRIPYN